MAQKAELSLVARAGKGVEVGTNRATSNKSARLPTAITAKASRHERAPESSVATGFPKRLANVIPAHMIATARVLWLSSANRYATMVPTP